MILLKKLINLPVINNYISTQNRLKEKIPLVYFLF